MNWQHVKLIFQREMLDQLRDRRTLFTIAVLPLLLYPLMGMMMMQIAQFKRDYTVRVQIIGAEHWPEGTPLLDPDGQLSPALEPETKREPIQIETAPWPDDPSAVDTLADTARQAIAANRYDAVLLVFPDFKTHLRARLENGDDAVVRTQGTDRGRVGIDRGPPIAHTRDARNSRPNTAETDATEPETSVADERLDGEKMETGPEPREPLQVIANMARDRSQTAYRRLQALLDRWRGVWVAKHLEQAGLSAQLVAPLHVQATDMASSSTRKAMLWSKLLPFVMLVWALTGAFYPAVDLCAGEKERGTLETLLSSPARRREIVWGKLATICVFSVSTALLNLMSMHLTAGIVMKQMVAYGGPSASQVLGPMPIHAFAWLILLLLPMAAFFSALALAVAALARSTKEGQYYLMPLLLVTLPLVALPMIPNLELSVATSLVPVSGAVFLVRSLIEGRFVEAAVHLPIVSAVTIACCWLSIRWAIRQFESESVMFRETDRWNLRLWMRQLWRDRGTTASPMEAVLCGVIILVAMFFAQMLAGASIDSWPAIVRSTVAVQIGVILTPALLMAVVLTRSLRDSLRLRWPRIDHLVGSLLLGVFFHPMYRIVSGQVGQVFEIGEETQAALQFFEGIVMAQPLWVCIALLALLPAVCEELTFRGFIFSGLMQRGSPGRAILVSALLFGFTHNLLPQSVSAALMGLLLGVVAWRTGSVLCTMIVHGLNNGMTIAMAWYSTRGIEVPEQLSLILRPGEAGWQYSSTWLMVAAFGCLVSVGLLWRSRRGTPAIAPADMAMVKSSV